MDVNFDKMCRTCMCEGKTMIPIFPMADDAPSYSDMLMTITAVRISTSDELPRQLCDACAISLDRAVAFKKLCEDSDSQLHQFISERTAEALAHQAVVKDELQAEIQYEPESMDMGHEYDDEFFMFKVEPETQLDEKTRTETEVKDDSTSLIKRTKLYPCPLCRKSYSNSKSLKRHAAVHQGEGFKCDRCERNFARRDHLRKHLQRVHSVTDIDAVMNTISMKPTMKYYCQFCSIDVPNKASMNKHLRARHRDKLPKHKTCSIDDFDGFKLEGSSENDEDVEDDTDDESKTIGRVTTSGGGAVATIKEERTNTGDGETRLVLEVTYKCALCNLQYDNQHSYAAHMTKHSGPLPKGQTQFTCTLCHKIFHKRKNLKQHLLTHNEEKANKCTLCHRAFTRPDQLILHMNNHTGKKRHQCSHCDKGFNMLSTLKDHIRTHSGEKPYLCSICGKGFSQNTNLKQHLMRHSAIKPFACPTCHAKFVSKGELDAHIRKHTGEHPFVCDTCGVGFTTSSSLVKHRRIHSGERPYACDLCPLRFTALGTLKNHRRTHTGEKPFECTHCNRAFTQKSDMVSHVRTHTGERPYVCSTCGAHYLQSSALKAHIKSHHPNLKQTPPVEIVIAPLMVADLTEQFRSD